MRRRRRLLALAAAALVLLAAATFLARPRADRINYANFLRIEPEMSREQVEAILGPPNFSESELRKMGYADFSRRIILDWEIGPFKPGPAQPADEQYWISNDDVIWVKFTNGRAVRKDCLQRGGSVQALLNRWLW